MAHVGVLKVLEKSGIKFDLIVGCSFGALVGGMYAQTARAETVERQLKLFRKTEHYKNLGIKLIRKPDYASDDFLKQFARNLRERVLLNVIVNRTSVLKEERLLAAVSYLIKEGRIEDTRIPFACNATDLVSGKEVLFTKGDIRMAIAASTAIPGYFPPIEFDHQKLVDGAVTYNLPIKFARTLGAKIVIAVDVHPRLNAEEDFRNVFDIIFRTGTITANLLTEECVNDADVLIAPEVNEFSWYDFERAEEFIKAGEEATIARLPEIEELTSSRKVSALRRLFRFGVRSKAAK